MRHWSQLTPLWIALLSLLVSAIDVTVRGVPEPAIHDEFSYLLAGDTYARGRLSNRPHELWRFFETFHVIHQPTYASKYPPAQGLFLALGQVAFGHPVFGVWISTALACAALWWGLAGVVPRRWATMGAVLAALHPLMVEWNHSYWGGAIPAAGGALVVGGVVRAFGRGNLGAGIGLGLGIFVLAISRPFEGAMLVVLSLLFMRTLAPRATRAARHVRMRAVAAAGIVVALGACWIGYFNWRVTGSALRMPYMLYEQTYAITSPFAWWPWSAQTPQYRHEVMRAFYLDFWLELYQRQRTLGGFFAELWDKLDKLARALFWPAVGLAPPLLVLPCAGWHDRVLRRALLSAVLFSLVVLGHLGFFPHYLAPALVLYLLILVQCVRHARAGLRRRGGRWIGRGVLAAQVIALVAWLATANRSRDQWHHQRAQRIAALKSSGGKYLVLVRHLPGANPHQDWVFNGADIDASAIVWARDMGNDRNRELLEYFADREVVLLEIDSQAARFIPYNP